MLKNNFKNLFYNNGDTFQINPQKYNVPELYLENQTILDVDGVQPFILFDEVIFDKQFFVQHLLENTYSKEEKLS